MILNEYKIRIDLLSRTRVREREIFKNIRQKNPIKYGIFYGGCWINK